MGISTVWVVGAGVGHWIGVWVGIRKLVEVVVANSWKIVDLMSCIVLLVPIESR